MTLVWFEPQRLLYDQRVEEPVPSSAPQQTPRGGATPTDAAGPAEVASGAFVSREHPTHGTARVLRLADNQEVVRLEGFATSNGPALVVWLSKNAADGPSGAFDDAHLDLGPLKGNVGNQNYPVPAGADTASYASVVVWCARFHVPFGAADLTPPWSGERSLIALPPHDRLNPRVAVTPTDASRPLPRHGNMQPRTPKRARQAPRGSGTS